jgi:hypothetical protein
MSKFTTKNKNTPRIPAYSLDFYPTSKEIEKNSINQHTNKGWNTEFDKAYLNLLKKTTKNDIFDNKFTCWDISEQEGIDRSSKFFLFNLKSFKMHTFEWISKWKY